MPDPRLQSRGDRELRELLLQIPAVRSANAERARDPQLQTRRMLLGSAVRLTAAMAPQLLEFVDHCVQKLQLSDPVELYVSPSPHFNAFSFASFDGRLYVGVTSSLLESLTTDELRFVFGHEFGHHLFGHHDIPIGALLRGPRPSISPGQALQLFRWQRYAEISADRTGLLCAGELSVAATAFFKIASGLSGQVVKFDIDEYLAQIGDIEVEAAKSRQHDKDAHRARPRGDWFASHPFSPLRVRAAQLCAGSELMKDGGSSLDDLEAAVHDLMSIMDPSYLQEKSESAEALRRLLFAGAVLVAAADGEVTEPEVERLEDFLGESNVPTRLNPDALRDDLPSRITFALEKTSTLRRAQVIRDLCVIAQADGHTSEEELEVIRDLATKIEVDAEVVDHTIAAVRAGLD